MAPVAQPVIALYTRTLLNFYTLFQPNIHFFDNNFNCTISVEWSIIYFSYGQFFICLVRLIIAVYRCVHLACISPARSILEGMLEPDFKKRSSAETTAKFYDFWWKQLQPNN